MIQGFCHYDLLLYMEQHYLLHMFTTEPKAIDRFCSLDPNTALFWHIIIFRNLFEILHVESAKHQTLLSYGWNPCEKLIIRKDTYMNRWRLASSAIQSRNLIQHWTIHIHNRKKDRREKCPQTHHSHPW